MPTYKAPRAAHQRLTPARFRAPARAPTVSSRAARPGGLVVCGPLSARHGTHEPFREFTTASRTPWP